MAKKPRSQRRGKKGSDDAIGDDAPDELPEDYTIAGSATSVSIWDDTIGDDDDDGNGDNDDLIGNVSERGMLAAASRLAKLRDALGVLDEFTTEKRSVNREARLRRG